MRHAAFKYGAKAGAAYPMPDRTQLPAATAKQQQQQQRQQQ
jgi:hypothetical protein